MCIRDSSQGVFGQFSGQLLPCILGMCLRMSSWLLLGSAFRVLSSISPPSSPYSGEEWPLLNSFSTELTVQCDGYLFHRPGFGLLVSVPRFLSTQPPFATQALKYELVLMRGKPGKRFLRQFQVKCLIKTQTTCKFRRKA